MGDEGGSTAATQPLLVEVLAWWTDSTLLEIAPKFPTANFDDDSYLLEVYVNNKKLDIIASSEFAQAVQSHWDGHNGDGFRVVLTRAAVFDRRRMTQKVRTDDILLIGRAWKAADTEDESPEECEVTYNVIEPEIAGEGAPDKSNSSNERRMPEQEHQQSSNQEGAIAALVAAATGEDSDVDPGEEAQAAAAAQAKAVAEAAEAAKAAEAAQAAQAAAAAEAVAAANTATAAVEAAKAAKVANAAEAARLAAKAGDSAEGQKTEIPTCLDSTSWRLTQYEGVTPRKYVCYRVDGLPVGLEQRPEWHEVHVVDKLEDGSPDVHRIQVGSVFANPKPAKKNANQVGVMLLGIFLATREEGTRRTSPWKLLVATFAVGAMTVLEMEVKELSVTYSFGVAQQTL
eukprot:TRINITY_DN55_c0_g1_i5.p1 TRINITY_DN55_c0_g1~~TRINITY_DN55_c0_g1_i5.p1  ORF type:complete len:418 (-),score=80.00 TRINITY_DN55_c0_g1_i5:1511-2710(-)